MEDGVYEEAWTLFSKASRVCFFFRVQFFVSADEET